MIHHDEARKLRLKTYEEREDFKMIAYDEVILCMLMHVYFMHNYLISKWITTDTSSRPTKS